MSIETIAVFTDFSENADHACARARELAAACRAALRVVHVVAPVMNHLLADGTEGVIPASTRQALMEDIQERLTRLCQEGEAAGVDTDYALLGGHVSTEILDYLGREPIDMAVMGAFGLSGMGLVLFGSVAKRVAHRAPCSVMIVRDRAA